MPKKVPLPLLLSVTLILRQNCLFFLRHEWHCLIHYCSEFLVILKSEEASYRRLYFFHVLKFSAILNYLRRRSSSAWRRTIKASKLRSPSSWQCSRISSMEQGSNSTGWKEEMKTWWIWNCQKIFSGWGYEVPFHHFDICFCPTFLAPRDNYEQKMWQNVHQKRKLFFVPLLFLLLLPIKSLVY